ncbi:MAG: hypothetical protein C0622_04330 [Desulfuromonas sp.]|nr:MAG: hypothetical protein C0622_04330 [Desulfuromonas sp.]
MNLFESLLQQAFDYGWNHTDVVLATAAVLALLTFFKTKEMFKFFYLTVLALAAFYLLSLLTDTLFTGTKAKMSGIERSRPADE